MSKSAFHRAMEESFDPFTRAYVEALLWTNDPHPGSGEWDRWEETFPYLDADDIQTAVNDCKAFQEANAELLERAGIDEQNGHDFYLTRCGHGTGFWDRGYPEEIGEALTATAHGYGEHDVVLALPRSRRRERGTASLPALLIAWLIFALVVVGTAGLWRQERVVERVMSGEALADVVFAITH